MSKEYPLSVQIAEVEREIKMRQGVYANRVRAGLMKQRDANIQLDIMREVLVTLNWARTQQNMSASER